MKFKILIFGERNMKIKSAYKSGLLAIKGNIHIAS